MSYQDYLESDHWKQLTAEMKRLAGYRCQLCNRESELHTHHRTYERKGRELKSDLVVLCASCHRLFHSREKALKLLDLEVNETFIDQFLEKQLEVFNLRARVRMIVGTVMSFSTESYPAQLYERLERLSGMKLR